MMCDKDLRVLDVK
uniref:Uncharacterized protein n=1 Tax=Steinernema glaseri TaxID=37863 RepID=A0A1I7Y679_9BILA